ncbi:hypothetical protein C8A01DRAFT_17571 [Parachaetomium inaequale]|uniref:DUF6594 domain-containing protein n=1 Tax=Parachaetomium inaequale TaxID=2588326 RepID=A0AAN6PG51_9PEZI|nr:hypothetical protein C8A01DRAFT_17571 [Parachaetomium inaequale]
MELLQTQPKAVQADPPANWSSDQQPTPTANGSNGPPEYKPQNYHRLAEIMSKDKNFAIFRRFDELNMLHLMALQAEILELRELFLSQLSLIPGPKKSQLSELQDWLRDKKGGKNFLQVVEFFTWRDDDTSSYTTMNPPVSEGDTFTDFITYRMASIFNRLPGRWFRTGKIVDEEAGLRSYSDSKLDKTSNVIAVIVASTLPVLTIFVLNSVGSTTARIGWAVLFTAVFAGILGLFSSAKRAELFAATAT